MCGGAAIKTRLCQVLIVLALGASMVAGRPAPALAAYPSPTVELQGHGWGHGRGMGQYGALGYALQRGWKYSQILEHFYGGTQSQSAGNPAMTVRLTAFDDADTVVIQQQAHLTTTADGGGGQYAALRAELIGPNQFRVDQGPGCQGPWTTLVTSTAGPVGFGPAVPTAYGSADRTELLQACLPAGGTRWLRGTMQAVDSGNGQRTDNGLSMEEYLLGVVPSESPASWGDMGGGAGMEALKAQAVAARSYAAAQQRYPYAKTCDSDACQVYRGRAVQDANGFRDVEDPRSSAAVVATSGEVRTSGGQVASTEFSSSTGGYTESNSVAFGGTQLPYLTAECDPGDYTSDNPNRTWQVTMTGAAFRPFWSARRAAWRPIQPVWTSRATGCTPRARRAVRRASCTCTATCSPA